MYQKEEITIKGVAPLLMNNARKANPLDEYAQKIKAIRAIKSSKRTDEDIKKLIRLEWEGGLYVNGEGYLHMPAENIEQMIIQGAKKSRLGTAFKSAVFVENDGELIYDGPKSIDKLWNKGFYKTCLAGTQTKTLVCYMMLPQWSLNFQISYDSELVDLRDILKAVDDQGRRGGLGAWRPRHGRFERVS